MRKKQSKIFYFDVETTGLDPKLCAIWQIGAIIEIDGKVEEEFSILMKPHEGAEIAKEALDTGNVTLEYLETLPFAHEGYRQLLERFEFYCSRYNKQDKFVPFGYNVGFDIDFLASFWYERMKDTYLFSWLFSCPVDIRSLVGLLVANCNFRFKNHKLETMCDYFNIPIKAHDALSDIRATRELYLCLKEVR